MIAIAAGEPYMGFNQKQCSVFFEPTRFRVAVNTSEQMISLLLRVGRGKIYRRQAD
jgi:hypothetical protein